MPTEDARFALWRRLACHVGAGLEHVLVQVHHRSHIGEEAPAQHTHSCMSHQILNMKGNFANHNPYPAKLLDLPPVTGMEPCKHSCPSTVDILPSWLEALGGKRAEDFADSQVQRVSMSAGEVTWHDDGIGAGVSQHDGLDALGQRGRIPIKRCCSHYWDDCFQSRCVILRIAAQAHHLSDPPNIAMLRLKQQEQLGLR